MAKKPKIINENIRENKELNIIEALIPVLVLMVLLAYNIFFADGVMLGDYSNQIILLLGGLVAAVMGFFNKVSIGRMITEIWENLRSVFVPIMILFLVGALAGTWLVSGIIPSMVYYGLKVLSPSIFLPASIIIAALISIATGSSWTTSATVGIALVGIGSALGIPTGMIAGAVISGAYFGDKMSPLSDTTNLAPAMAGTDLFTHIKYMSFTTVPSIIVTLIVFSILSISLKTEGNADVTGLLNLIDDTFTITPWLFIVPAVVVALVLLKTKPIIALASGVVLAGVFAFVFQPDVLKSLSSNSSTSIVNSILFETNVEISDEEFMSAISEVELEVIKSDDNLSALFTGDDLKKNFSDEELSNYFSSSLGEGELRKKVEGLKGLMNVKKLRQLFSAGGMKGMLWTIYLIICAMVFGGIMDAIGALSRITSELLSVAKSVFGLFASTVVSCLGLNLVASDQYLALVIPGKMFEKAYKDRGLAPENLSRTLEDSGTVTSVLVPWNTCGAYQAGVLGVDTTSYIGYAIFNWLSPIMTLMFAAFNISRINGIKKALLQESKRA